MIEYYDMHCHLDFAPEPAAAARALAGEGVAALSCTVTPAGYETARTALAAVPNVRVGLGLHPWWVPALDASATCGDGEGSAAKNSTDRAQGEGRAASASAADLVATFERYAAHERFFAEVGLDFSPRHAGAREAQLAAFARIAACAATGGKVLSLHAVRAATQVLDVLEAAGALAPDAGNACIFHWFSGTSDELARAVRAGAFFSVNPRMLDAKRGRAYVRAIPADRLLLETDGPAREGDPVDALAVRAQLEQLVARIAAERGDDPDDLRERIARTSEVLLAGQGAPGVTFAERARA